VGANTLRTALLLAAEGGSRPLVAALLERRANPQAAAWVENGAQTPLDVAAARHHDAVCQLLRTHGARTAEQLWRPELGAPPARDDGDGSKAVPACIAPAWC